MTGPLVLVHPGEWRVSDMLPGARHTPSTDPWSTLHGLPDVVTALFTIEPDPFLLTPRVALVMADFVADRLPAPWMDVLAADSHELRLSLADEAGTLDYALLAVGDEPSMDAPAAVWKDCLLSRTGKVIPWRIGRPTERRPVVPHPRRIVVACQVQAGVAGAIRLGALRLVPVADVDRNDTSAHGSALCAGVSQTAVPLVHVSGTRRPGIARSITLRAPSGSALALGGIGEVDVTASPPRGLVIPAGATFGPYPVHRVDHLEVASFDPGPFDVPFLWSA